MSHHITHKAGASNHARPAVQTAFTATGNAGSHSVAASKLRALAEAMGGPCIVRDVDGDSFLLTVERLQVINIPLSHSTASSSEAKQYHA